MPSFQNGIFGCFSSPVDCLIGAITPCIIYGETEYRLKNTVDISASGNGIVNTDCLMWYFVGYFTCGIYSCLKTSQQRTAVRKKANIAGNGCEDCAWACFCHCCVLIQNKHEFEDMQAGTGIYESGQGIVAKQPTQVSGMVYKKPQNSTETPLGQAQVV